MRQKIQKTLQKHALWLSLLLHSLLVSTYFVVWSSQLPTIEKSEPAPSYVPSYVQNNPIEKENQQEKVLSENNQAEKTPVSEKEKPRDKKGIEKRAMPKTQQLAQQKPVKAAMPRRVEFSRNQVPEEIADPTHMEPMHLIGETKIIKPIIKILAKALSEHLTYPKIAQDFNLRGVVLVGFVLDPQGYVTDTKIVKSSGAGVLDDAARNAVRGMSPVVGVDIYLKKPEFMVVGIIFG